MLEIHLYFTPMLDNLDEFDRNDWYLYPVVNLSAAKACRDQAQYPKTVEYLNACSDRLEKIALDFFTVNLYGRKFGRKFILQLQNNLTVSRLLDYNNSERKKILTEIGLSTSEFKVFRDYSKHVLKDSLHQFYENNFTQTPSGIVLTESEELHLAHIEAENLKTFIEKLEKTA
ncbi:DsbA family protein [Lactococcus fujiensis]|uniref:Dithiol-disulfide isomerase n=1 Tax=Lactococcus fujiensis JCM 16395 TaxID=1291764 RepID=A0A2A5RMX4_9LACT|nr:DsbA family protein [Lactococcus fujiensis]PCS00702.1 dithiol-disulfide isomerase [Lactococcus fujiensis JCM 16395]